MTTDNLNLDEDIIKKAQELERSNSVIRNYYANPHLTKDYQNRKQKRSNSLIDGLNHLSKIFHEPLAPYPVAFTKPDDKNSPLSLPPHVYYEIFSHTYPHQTDNPPTSPSPASTHTTHPHQTDNPEDNTETPITVSPITIEAPPDNIDDIKTSTSTPPPISPITIEAAISDRIEADMTIKTSTSPTTSTPKKKRGRPPKRSLLIEAKEKLSQTRDIDIEKLSHDKRATVLTSVLPLCLQGEQTDLRRGKSSLYYLSIYSSYLTPEEVRTLLAAHASEPFLTAAEIIALNLINEATLGNEKSQKLYWQQVSNREKTEKKSQKTGNGNSLLEAAIEADEVEIFGDFVKKPIDNPTDKE